MPTDFRSSRRGCRATRHCFSDPYVGRTIGLGPEECIVKRLLTRRSLGEGGYDASKRSVCVWVPVVYLDYLRACDGAFAIPATESRLL